LRQLSAQSDDALALHRRLKLSVEIRSIDGGELFVESDKDIIRWVIDLKNSAKWFSSPLRLIGENLDDASAYFESARHYCAINSIAPSMRRATLEITGGCGNADRILNARISDELSPILCIIDSDRLLPNGSAAIDKCTRIEATARAVVKFIAVEQRELENLLPNSFVEGAILELDRSSDRDNLLDNLKILRELRQSNCSLYDYVDIKNGTCVSWVESKGEPLTSHYSNAKLVQACNCSAHCKGKYSPALFENVLGKALKYMNNLSAGEIRSMMGTEDAVAWRKLGENTFAMAVANNARLT
jgi:hypothetical protein